MSDANVVSRKRQIVMTCYVKNGEPRIAMTDIPASQYQLYCEDYDIQIQAAARSINKGYYALAKAELRGAILILDTMEKQSAADD